MGLEGAGQVDGAAGGAGRVVRVTVAVRGGEAGRGEIRAIRFFRHQIIDGRVVIDVVAQIILVADIGGVQSDRVRHVQAVHRAGGIHQVHDVRLDLRRGGAGQRRTGDLRLRGLPGRREGDQGERQRRQGQRACCREGPSGCVSLCVSCQGRLLHVNQFRGGNHGELLTVSASAWVAGRAALKVSRVVDEKQSVDWRRHQYMMVWM